jgi:formamidopyrimidine-DNA glycosylase
MPELPEVQTIINLLNESKAINQTITSIDVFCPKLLKNCSVKTFQKQLVNEKITTISRIGKYLIFHLTNKKVLVIHLRMEGKLFYQVNACQTKSPHLHIQINFANHAALQYFDSRKFGTFHLFNESNYLKSPELSKIAYDPLNPECNAAY